jgi:hypothetical protein
MKCSMAMAIYNAQLRENVEIGIEYKISIDQSEIRKFFLKWVLEADFRYFT